MAFIQDPRLRQRWNQISHTTEAVTENAAAGIWTLQHRYVSPCLSAVGRAADACTSVCVGDREERARRARERDRGARRGRARSGASAGPEHAFDFYDDWTDDEDYFGDGFGGSADEDEQGGPGALAQGILGRIAGRRAEDWDRLLAGTGRRDDGEGRGGLVDSQPRRKRGMSYGTRGIAGRRKVSEGEDPTIIPSTAPLGFLGRLPFRIGGTLRYKPSAANLKEHPGGGGAGSGREEVAPEREPLLGSADGDEEEVGKKRPRQRSNTSGSGDTSDSYRSRNDLFPSDEEGEEDAVPLDDEFAVALDRVDDRGSTRTRSSKGKRVPGRSYSGASLALERTVSRTTIGSNPAGDDGGRMGHFDGALATPTLEDLEREEEEARRDEDEQVESKRRRAAMLAAERGLGRDEPAAIGSRATASEMRQVDGPMESEESPLAEPEDMPGEQPVRQEEQQPADMIDETEPDPEPDPDPGPDVALTPPPTHQASGEFVPARLPHFR